MNKEALFERENGQIDMVSTLVRHEQGYEVFVVRNENLEVSLVPKLGAKIISLVNRRTGREWMSCPVGGRKLFPNRLGDNFAMSTLVGWDECLPTIAPCAWKNRRLPDHGEVWSVPWMIDLEAFNRGELKTSVDLAISPFHFERSLRLHQNEIHLHYELENLGDQPEEFLWAMHPLTPIYEGDTFELTDETRELLANPPWLDSLDFGITQPAYSKIYAGPLRESRAAIKNLQSGDRMTFSWDTKSNHTLGVWLTRGGWNGQHHQALEPSNGWPDALADACARNQCGMIPPRARLNWQVRIQIEPGTTIAKPNACCVNGRI
jgi:hypothetical protein